MNKVIRLSGMIAESEELFLETESIDLMRILRILKRRLWLILVVASLSIGVSGFYTFFVVDELYSADVLLYIWQDSQDGESGSVQYNDLMLYSQLVNDYQVLCKSRLVTNTVAEQLGLDSDTRNNLADMINVGTKDNTRHLTITVTDRDPGFAAIVANKVAEVFSDVVVDKMGAANVQIIDDAVPPVKPSFPNKTMNLAIGLIIGMMLGVGLVFLVEFLDTTVKTSEDVEAITGFTMLGVIPEFAKDPAEAEGRRR